MAAGGCDALEWDSERSKNGKAPRDWLRTKGNSIEGGTSEIQLNIVAKHILGLPRSLMMALLTDDQKMLQETARELPRRGRQHRRSSCATGATPTARTGSGTALWKQFGELGLDRHLHPRGATAALAWARPRPRWCSRRSAAT